MLSVCPFRYSIRIPAPALPIQALTFHHRPCIQADMLNPVLEVLGVVRLLHLHSLSFSLSAIPRLRVGGHGIPVFLYFVYFFIISLSAEIVNY